MNVNGCTLDVSQTLHVGDRGSGSLTLAGNGTVQSKAADIGRVAESSGTVLITDGHWQNEDAIFVGVDGNGTLEVDTQDRITGKSVYIGQNATGTTTVSGGNITLSQTLAEGVSGTGYITVTEACQVSAQFVQVGVNPGSTGTITLSENAMLDTASLVAGMFGTPTFNMSTGNLLNAENIDEAEISGTGVLNVHGGTVTTAAIQGGGSGATVNLFDDLGADNALGTGNVRLETAELRASSNATLSGNIGSGIPLISVAGNQTGTFSAAAGQTLTLAPLDFLLVAGSTMLVGSSGNTGTVFFAPNGAVALAADTSIAVDYGTLQAGNSGVEFLTAIAASTTVAAGGTLDFQDHVTSGGIFNLQGSGTVNIGANATKTLTVSGGNFSGSITGAGGLLKTSAGTLILSGNSTYQGGTKIDEGLLIVNGILESGFGEVDVNTGGMLGGSGSVGAVSLNGGTIAPGNSPGTLTMSDLHWTSGTIVFELGPTPEASDLIETGTLQGLGTTYEFTFVDQGMVIGIPYDIIEFAGPPMIAPGNFTFTNGGGFNGTFGYDGSTLQFTVIPEPSTWGLLLLGSLLLAARFRQRG